MEKKYYRMIAGKNPFDPAIGAREMKTWQMNKYLQAIKKCAGVRITMGEMSRAAVVKRKWKKMGDNLR